MGSESSFLQRWSRRKHQSRRRLSQHSALPTHAEPDAFQGRLGPPAADRAAPAGAHFDAGLEELDASRTGGPGVSETSGAISAAGAASAQTDRVPAIQPDTEVQLGTEVQPGTQDLRRQLDDLRGLQSDYRSFLASNVDEATRRSALKRLFADPHFNQMDGLDVYVDDYSKPASLPAAAAAALNALRYLGSAADAAGSGPAADNAGQTASGTTGACASTLADAGAPSASPQDDAMAPASASPSSTSTTPPSRHGPDAQDPEAV